MPAAMHEAVIAWYRENGSDLPWRRTRDPYAILVSEVMLQQYKASYPRILSIPFGYWDCGLSNPVDHTPNRARNSPEWTLFFRMVSDELSHGR